MEPFRDYVQRATRRLRADPAVHWDVSRELEAHLEDAAEEARAAGATDREAEQRALKTFGDPEPLADQLWLANRRRMRLRAVGKWLTRLALVPGAVVLAVAVAAYGFDVAACVVRAVPVNGRSEVSVAFARGQKPRPRAGLSEDARWLYEHTQEGFGLDGARAIAARFPDDPVIHAMYVRYLSDRALLDEKVPPELQEEWMRALERGRKLDPDNAFYDYLLAYMLLARSTEVADTNGIVFEYQPKGWRTTASKETQKEWLPTLRVIDRQVFVRAIEAVRTGFRKPKCSAREREWSELMQGLWQDPPTYGQLISQLAYRARLLMPHLGPLRDLARRLPSSALLLAELGSHGEAVELARGMHRPGVQLGADGGVLISLLVARDMLINKTGGAAPQILRELGEPEAALAAQDAFEAELDAYATAVPEEHPRSLEQTVKERGGILALETIPVLAGKRFEPWLDATRVAEHLLVERMTLAVLLAGGAATLLLLAAAFAWSAWRHPEAEDRPMLLFIGWRHLALVLLLGLMLPVGLYVLETRAAPWGSFHRGIGRVLLRRGFELGDAFLLIVFGTALAAYSAVRRRCEEAGMDVPPRGQFNPLRQPAGALAALLLAVALGAGAAGIIAPPAGDEADAGLLLAVAAVVAAAVFPFVFLLWQLRHIGYVARPGGVIARGFAAAGRRTPLWLVAAGAVVLSGGAMLLYGFLAAVSLATMIASFGLAALLPVLAYGYSRTKFVTPVEGLVRFRRTMLRSLIPVVAAWVLLLGVGAGQYLSHAEAAALEPLSRPGARWFEELEATDFVKYREHLREVNERWLRENVWRPAAGAQAP